MKTFLTTQRICLALAASTLLILLPIGCGGSHSAAPTGSGNPTHTNIGVNTYIYWDQWPGTDTSALDATLAMDKKIGFTAIRIPMYWEDIDRVPNGTYTFSVYENAVQSIVKAGLQPVIVAQTTHSNLPSTQWGASQLGFPITTSDANLFSSMIAATAADLNRLVPAGNLVIEIGNENNLLSSDITKADAYAALYTSCRSKTSSSVSLAGPCVSTFQDGSGSTVVSTVFAQRCKNDGMSPDIFSAHLYNGVNPPSALLSTESQLATMAGSAPFWITECGYPSGPSGNPNAVSPSTQASNVLYEAQTFPTYGAAKVFIYGDRDRQGWCGSGIANCQEPSTTASPQEGYFGVMDHSLNLKPAGSALQTYLFGP